MPKAETGIGYRLLLSRAAALLLYVPSMDKESDLSSLSSFLNDDKLV
jgi:hypothetical protein